MVPTKLTIERTSDVISITVDRDSFEPAEITVGSRMLTGVQRELYIYRVGEPRPARSRLGLGGPDFNIGTDFVNAKLNGIPVPGESYVVEIDLAIFETDIPAQHFWSPEGGKYMVLWTRTLSQVVE
jgi:hypothetical protein